MIKRIAIIAGVAVAALLGLTILGHISEASQIQTVWCEDVAPGSQYESNDIRYISLEMGPGTGLNSPTQACATMDTGSETFVPSSAP